MPVHVIYAANSDGSGAASLTPTFTTYRRLESGTDLSGSAPTISELGNGWYKFSVTELNSTCGAIDLGAGPATRYLWAVFAEGSASIQPYLGDRGLVGFQ